jgi:hypothetical protein
MRRVNSKQKRGRPVDRDEILPEYDFSRGRPNKYAARDPKGSSVVVLQPDVAAVFPDAEVVNDALRSLARLIQKHESFRSSTRRPA